MPESSPRTSRIAQLPPEVQNQIAAGEVVERPASVLKELVENAIDAGASQIEVDLEEGGVQLVRVRDDGIGMGPEDLQLAFAPHATSKLRGVDDLEHIASLGFRGEALASIGSVARCKLYSRPAEQELGYEMINEGGRLEGPREAGGPPGTRLEVRDLFFNTPARRRFLKSTRSELSRCQDLLQRLAMAHVGIGFRATHDKKRLFDVEAGMDLLDRVRRTFGSELADTLVPVEAEANGVRLSGYVAPPRFARRDTGRQMWFLNGRALKDRVLSACLRESYRGFMVEMRQPVVFLSLSMDPARVDVNVHPTKSEVRFRDERPLFGFLVRALREAIAKTDVSTPGEALLRGPARRGEWSPAGASHQPTLPDPGALRPRGPGRRDDEPLVVQPVPGGAGGASAAPMGEPAFGAPDAGAVREPTPWDAADDPAAPVLQVADTYLVRATPDGFEIVDQHALHERLTYEELKADLAAGRVECQRLLTPELVELPRDEVDLVGGQVEALRPLGLEIDVFGPTTLAVHGVPARMRRVNAEELVADLVTTLRELGRAPSPGELLEELLHSRACRSSVMAGDPLTQSEIRSLLERAGRLASDQTCPHGRPTRVRFTLADLEKAFHRK